MHDLIQNTASFVQSELQNAEAGHDWSHIERAWRNAKLIASGEACDLQIVELAALLHDIADPKFHGGDESVGPKKAKDFLESQKVNGAVVSHVVAIIENMSFKNSFGDRKFHSKELDIVQDADRLDAIGMVGAARCFYIAGRLGSGLYDPFDPLAAERPLDDKRFAIDHFETKLFKLADGFQTGTGRKFAEARHDRLKSVLAMFIDEI